jgi:hypothetical protein
MPRAYFRHTTSIWVDDDFRRLTPEQQGLYFLLSGQSEVTAAGTLPLRPRRWSNMAATWTPERIQAELAVLVDEGHVVVDEATEELLIVKFVKWDGGFRNSKRIPVIRDAAFAVESPTLRAVLARELARLGLSDVASRLDADRAPDRLSDSLSGMADAALSDGVSDAVPDATTGFDRYRETLVGNEPLALNPLPSTPTPSPVAAANGIGATATAQTILGEWLERVKRPPSGVIGQVGKHVRAMLAEGIEPDDVRRGLAAWAEKGLHPSTLPSVVNEAMNGRPRKPRQQQDTDDMFDRAARRMGVIS